MNGHNKSAPMNGHDSVDCSVRRTNGSSPSKTHFSKQSFISHKTPNSTYTETSTWLSGHSEGGVTNGQAAANTAKSFIQQRVERLYGRGALAQGFFRQTKLNGDSAGNLHSKSSDTTNEHQPASLPELPVLRHLRPEFREQLSINSPHSTPWWRHRQPPPCTSNGTEHIIPITLEADHPAVKPSELHSSEAENEMSTSIKIDVATQAEEAPRDLQPAAPDVMVLSAESSLPAVTSSQEPQQKDPDLKDGHYFLKLLGKECERLLSMAAETEKELEANPELPEEASGKLRAAIGQARLLVRQKLQQFEGLCHRNLSQSCDEQFPTTCDDLAGFWDMVQLQVAHVDSLFAELAELRQRNWQELNPRKVVKNGSSKAAGTRRSTTPKSSPQLSEKAQEAARQRDEQRKKMMEERRRTAKLQKNQQDAVEIFAPDTTQ